MSLIKFKDRTNGNGRGKVFWNRAEEDGAPFRGPNAPTLKEAEFESLTRQVWDAKVETFDISDPESKKKLEEILDAASNQWYRVLFMDRQYVPERNTWMYLVEYAIPFRELSRNLNNEPVAIRTSQ